MTFAWYVSQLSFKYKNILSGFFVGLTASLRPPAILMFIPFLIYKKWDLLIGSIIGLLSSLFLSLIVAKFSIWQSYFFSMSGMTKVINLSQHTDNNTDIIYPQVIEGLNNINSMNQIPHASSSIKSMFNFLGIDLTIPYMIVLGFIFIAITASLFIVSLPHKDISLNLVFLSGVTIYLVSEFFIPIGRDTYNDVQWILPLSLIVIEANTTKLLNNKLIGILFIGLLLSIGCLGWIPKFLLVSVYFIAFYVFSTSVILLRQQKRTKKYSI